MFGYSLHYCSSRRPTAGSGDNGKGSPRYSDAAVAGAWHRRAPYDVWFGMEQNGRTVPVGAVSKIFLRERRYFVVK